MTPALAPTGTAARLRRAGTVAGLMLVTAVGAHVAGGGHLPGPGVLAALAAVLAAGSLVTHGRLGRLPAVGLLGAAQYAVHHVVVLTSDGVVAGAACRTGHAHANLSGCLAPARAGHDAGSGASAGWLDTPMLVLHAVATVVTAIGLAQGDQLLATLATALLPWLRVPVLETPIVDALRADSPAVVEVALPTARRWLTGRPRRGPPRAVGVARCLPA